MKKYISLARFKPTNLPSYIVYPNGAMRKAIWTLRDSIIEDAHAGNKVRFLALGWPGMFVFNPNRQETFIYETTRKPLSTP
jgi:hypothetical protein